MRGSAALLALLLLSPTASGATALAALTEDETLVVVLASPVLMGSEEPHAPPPQPDASAPEPREDLPDKPPADDVILQVTPLPETPLPLRAVEVRRDDGRSDEPHAGRKAERLDLAADPGRRAEPPLPLARLSIEPVPRPFEVLAPARVPPPDAAPRPRAEDPAPSTGAAPAAPTEDATPGAWRAAAAAAGLALAILAPFLLYHRARGAETLRNTTRARLLEVLTATPGLSPADAGRAMGVDPTTALYHLRRLVAEGLAVCEGPPRGARYFAAGTMSAEERARAVALRGSTDVLRAVEAAPGVTKTQLAEGLAIARATLGWHLARLERAGVVRYERAGRTVRVFPAKQVLS